MRHVSRAMMALVAGLVMLWARVAAGEQCKGDFNGDNTVGIEELIMAVNSALSGCPDPGPRFVDNGDGTVTDTQTGLMWEKKSDDDSIHDKDNQYSWSLSDSSWGYWDGTVFTDFLAALNAEAFAGCSDWGLPTLDELQTLIDRETGFPAMDRDAFDTCTPGCTVTMCSCTSVEYGSSAGYWSSKGLTTDLKDAWVVDFTEGKVDYALKHSKGYVRAVRGGFSPGAS